MVRSLVLLSLLIVSYTMEIKMNGCTCDEVLKQSECDGYHPDGGMNCDWNEQTNICEADPRITCSMIDGPETCRVQAKCGWVSGKCVDFKQCSDYKETVDLKCNNINSKCIVDGDKCGTEKPIECESFAVENCKQTSDNLCVLSGTPAVCVTMKTCSDGSYNSDQCKKNSKCFWETDKCRDKKCSDIQTKDSCMLIFSFYSPYATLCHWTAENKCVDGEDEHYTAETCFKESAQSKVWKDGQCRSCTDSPVPGYSKVISVIMILFAIIMV